MQFQDIVVISEAVAATAARNEKIELLAGAVGAMEDDELTIGVSYLAGVLPQGSIGVGYAALRELPAPSSSPSLTLPDVDGVITRIANTAGAGSTAARREQLNSLFERATAAEAEFLIALLVGGIRQGANEKVMMDAVAKASGVPGSLVRRAVMFSGDVGRVAAIARNEGRAGVAGIGLRLFQPVLPMLAKSADSVTSAFHKLDVAAVERKIDGARIQAHVSDGVTRIFTRNLNDVTERLPEIVTALRRFNVASVVLDGEAIALRPDGKPHPFQITMARFGSEADAPTVELTPFFFDILHLDGVDVFDCPAAERFELLDRIVPERHRVPRLVTSDPSEAEGFFAETIGSGHEGVMVKSVEARYEAGRRGAGWLKVKPVHTLDLVVLAVEWGSGRRRGRLSNIHLGARDPGGGFVMLGKTFKGMTDKMLEWQTARFLELETRREGHVVYLRPEQVVEIAFDGIQASSRYPGGMALRFARVKGYRKDKSAAEADTIDTVRALLEGR